MKTKLLGLICLYLLTIGECHAQYKNLEIPLSQRGKKELILKRQNYTLSFNKETNIPNWVAWSLDKKKLIEQVSRKGFNFRPDPDIEKSDAVVTQDYAHSGYDRGHMCPAGDSRWSAQAMKESFYMTNICPQHPNLNGGDWHELEQACRKWAEKDKLYIVFGPIGHHTKNPLYFSTDIEDSLYGKLFQFNHFPKNMTIPVGHFHPNFFGLI